MAPLNFGPGSGFAFGGGGGPAPTPTVPGVISGLTATPGNGQMTLAWPSPSSGGSPITDYLIQYKLASEPTTWTTWAHSASTSRTALITGLTNGVAYNGRVFAINAIGQQTTPSNITNVTPATVPSAPTLAVTPGDEQVTVAWTDGATGGSAITARRLYRSTTSGFTPDPSTLIATSPTFPYVDTGLTNGTAYYYKGIAVNAVGPGAASTQQPATPSATPVVAPVISYTAGTFSNDNSDAGQWYRDDSAISGQTGSSYTYNAATDEGRWIGQRVGGVLSNVIVIEAENPVTLINFNQANGTKLSAYPSTPFTLRGGTTGFQDGYTCQSNQMQTTAQSGDAPRAIATRPTGSTEHYAEFKTTSGTAPELVTNAVDENTFLATTPQDAGAGRWAVVAFIGNGGYAQGINQAPNGFQVPGSTAAGQIVRVVSQNGKWQFRINGQPYAKSVFFGTDAVPADAWYDLPAGLVSAGGREVGLLNPYSTATCDDFQYQSLSKPVIITSSEIVSTWVDGVAERRVRLTGTASPAALNNAVTLLVLKDTGQLLSGWTAASGAPGIPGGSFTIDSQLIPEGVSGDVDAYLSDNANKVVTTHSVVDVPSLLPFAIGVNSGQQTSLSQSDPFRDRARQGEWVWSGTGPFNGERCPLNDNYWPVGPFPSGITGIILKLWSTGGDGIRQGNWLLTTNTPATIAPDNPINLTPGVTTSTTFAFNTNAPAGQNINGLIKFTGFTWPSDGFQVSCIPVGAPGTTADICAPAFVAAWSASNLPGVFWRDMKDSGAEGSRTIPNRYYGSSWQFAADFTQKTLGNWYHNFPWSDAHYRLETFCRDWITNYNTNARSGAFGAFAVGNEEFNASGDFMQFYEMAAAANQVTGCYPIGLIPDGTIMTNEVLNVDPSTGVTNKTFADGDWFVCTSASYSNSLVECIANAPVGATVPTSGSNSYFAIRAGFNVLMDAVRRFQAHLQKQISILAKSIMGARAISVYECFILDNATNLAGWITFDDAHLHIDAYSPSFYSGARTDYASLPWASSYSSNFAAFKAGYYALRRTTADEMVDKLVALKAAMRAAFVTLGKDPATCPRQDMYYEGGPHDTIGFVPSGDQQGVVDAILACHTSTAEYDETLYMFTRLATELGGTYMYFADVARPVWNGGQNQVQHFALRNYQSDGTWNSNGATEQRYKAALAMFA